MTTKEVALDTRCAKCIHVDGCLSVGHAVYCSFYTESGRQIFIPVDVGQSVWFIRGGKIIETFVEKVILKQKGLYIKLACNAMYETSCNSIGKTVFLTERAAQQALNEKK
jgi:hypothetical protein